LRTTDAAVWTRQKASNAERPAGVIHLVARREIDVRKRLHQVEHPAGMHVDAGAAQ